MTTSTPPPEWMERQVDDRVVDLAVLATLAAQIDQPGVCIGPVTTFEGDRARVTTICARQDFVAYLRWLHAMVRDVPALVRVVEAALVARDARAAQDRHRSDVFDRDPQELATRRFKEENRRLREVADLRELEFRALLATVALGRDRTARERSSVLQTLRHGGAPRADPACASDASPAPDAPSPSAPRGASEDDR